MQLFNTQQIFHNLNGLGILLSHISQYWIIIMIFSATIMTWACTSKTPTQSELYTVIFQPERAGTFRGVYLKDDIAIAKRLESPDKPSYEDPLGIVYTLPLPENEEMIIEYYTPLVSDGSETNQITAIVANIILKNEVQADALYKEIESIYTEKYGFPIGKYGNYVWEGVIQQTTNTGMEIILKMDGSKNKISINFIDQQLN